MFTTGRIIFTIVFICLFIAVLIWAYRKDMREVRRNFPKPWLVLLGFLAIVIIYYFLSRV